MAPNDERLVEIIDKNITDYSILNCPKLLEGSRILVLRDPGKIKHKDDIKKWLQWWVQWLEAPSGLDIVMLHSPSIDYDPLVKMVARASGITWSNVTPNAKADEKCPKYKKELVRIEVYKQQRKQKPKMGSEHESVTESPNESEEESGKESIKQPDPKHNTEKTEGLKFEVIL